MGGGVCYYQELAEDCLSLCDGGAGLGLEKEPEAMELAAILRLVTSRAGYATILYSFATTTKRYGYVIS